jgi:hypothetical protein
MASTTRLVTGHSGVRAVKPLLYSHLMRGFAATTEGGHRDPQRPCDKAGRARERRKAF